MGEVLPALLALAATLLVVRPLFLEGFPSTHDGMNHLLHFAGFADAVEQGDWYPRWTGLLNLEYGSPLYTFYAPLCYAVAEVFHLAGRSVVDSVLLVFALGMLLSCLSMYLLVRDFAGRAAGFAAGVAYAALPYQFHDVYVRGALGEAFALALMPWTLWCYTRFARCQRTVWLGLGGVSIALLVLTHNISALMFLPLLGLWLCGLGFEAADLGPLFSRARLSLLVRMAAAVALGVGLSAFFWLPALLQKDAVHLERATASYDYHGFFNQQWPPWQTTWGVDFRYDPKLFPVRPGLVQLLLGVAGGAGLALGSLRDNKRRLWLMGLLPFGALLLFLQREQSTVLWEHVPLAAYVQFPYRLMGLFGIATSICAGYIVAVVPWRFIRGVVALMIACASLAAVLTTIALGHLDGLPRDFDARAMLAIEAARGHLSGAADSEYTPRWVSAPTSDLIATVWKTVDVQPVEVPTPLSVRVTGASNSALELAVSASVPSTLLLHQFFMPEWKATANGQAMVAHPSGPFGLLAVDVPQGSEQRVLLVYGLTPLERLANVLAVVCGFGLFLLVVGVPRDRWRLFRGVWIALYVVAAVVVVGLVFIPRAPALGAVLPLENTAVPGYSFVGARTETAHVATQAAVRVTLYVVPKQRGADLLFRMLASDSAGRIVADVTQRPWNGPTTNWLPNELATTTIDVPIPAGAGPQSLTFTVKVMDAQRPNQALAEFALPNVQTPATPPNPFHVLGATFGGDILVQGYAFGVPEQSGTVTVKRGRALDVAIGMVAMRRLTVDETLFVHLLDQSGKLQAQHDELAGGTQHPTSRWDPGDPWRQRVTVVLPPTMPAGVYRVELGLYHLETTPMRLRLLDPGGRPVGDAVTFGTIMVQDGE